MVMDVTNDNGVSNPNFIFTMTTSSTLTANILYKLVITTHDGSQP